MGQMPIFSVFNSHNSDAGRLFLVDSIPKFTKDPTALVLRLFTQVINHYISYILRLFTQITEDRLRQKFVGLGFSKQDHSCTMWSSLP